MTIHVDAGTSSRRFNYARWKSGGVTLRIWHRSYGWETAGDYAALKALYDGGEPLVYRVSGTQYAERADLADPDGSPRLLTPHKWMLEQHPFNPRSETDVVHVDGFGNLPDQGREDISYIVEDSSSERPSTLFWDGSDYQISGAVGQLPQRQQYNFARVAYSLRDDGAATPENAGTPSHVPLVNPKVSVRENIGQTVIITVTVGSGATFNGWTVRIQGLNAGTSGIGYDAANSLIQINVVQGATYDTAVADLNADPNSVAHGLTFALADGITGTNTVNTIIGEEVTVTGGADEVTRATMTFSALPAEPTIPTAAVDLVASSDAMDAPLDTIRFVTDFRGHVNYKFQVDVDLDAADAATWYDSGSVGTGAATEYRFRWRLWLRRAGRDDFQVITSQIRGSEGTRTVAVANFSAIFEAGDELYATLEAEDDSTAATPLASALTIGHGQINARRYVSSIAPEIRAAISAVPQPHLVLWQWSATEPAAPGVGTTWGDQGWPADVTPWAATPPASPEDGSTLWAAHTSASKASGSWVQTAWNVIATTDGTLPGIEYRRQSTTGWVTADALSADQIRVRLNGRWTPWFPTERYHFSSWQPIHDHLVVTGTPMLVSLDQVYSLLDYVELRVDYDVLGNWYGSAVWPVDEVVTVLESDTVGGFNYLHPRRRHGEGLSLERRTGGLGTGLPNVASGFSGWLGLIRPASGGTGVDRFDRLRLVTDPDPALSAGTYNMNFALYGR